LPEHLAPFESRQESLTSAPGFCHALPLILAVQPCPVARASQGEGDTMILPAKKQELIAKFRTHESDTGSPEVQVAIMTARINELTEHFQTHKKDHHSRRGLLQLVSKRRGLLDYVKKVDAKRYKTLIDTLSIRK